MYKHLSDPEVCRKLRDDARIRAAETSAKRNEPKRIASSQALKATGSSAGLSVALVSSLYVTHAMCRHLHGARAPEVCRLVPQRAKEPEQGLSWPSGPRHVFVGCMHRIPRRELADAPVVRHLPIYDHPE